MGKIVVLDDFTSNRIAAGEVIERPSSVVKELVENSIDAGATNISVEIRNGGISYIRVTDNGSGMQEDDVQLAFERHATSKIRRPEDLDSISTLGFRGEALASIAAVSRVEMTTRAKGSTHGTKIEIDGGILKSVKETGCPEGTSFVIRDLFYNTPARYKFLKKDSTEAGHISDIITRISLGNPHISIRLLSNGTLVSHTPGNNDLLSTIFSLYGSDTAKKSWEVCYKDEKVSITGYAGAPEIARSSKNYQSFYVNGRYVKSKIIASAVEEAYKTTLLKNKYPFIVLKLEINPLLVDVNVHPAKMEVRFSAEKDIYLSVLHAVENTVINSSRIKGNDLVSKSQKAAFAQPEYVQQNIGFSNTVSDCHTQADIKASAQIIPERDNLINFDKNIIREEKDVFEIKGEESTSIKEKDLLENAKIIGQVFYTYIILQYEDDLILVDQHAAHERVIFENLKKKFYNDEPISQILLTPVVVELSHQETGFVSEHAELFNKMGFDIESFGSNSVIIRSVPFSENSGDIKAVFLEVIDELMNSYNREKRLIIEEGFYTIACKLAVKANKKLNEAEIRNVLTELKKLENPFTCPHGRPTAVRFKKHEIEKEFKRIL
jgi:DNA mismatch repair protein MutL